MSTHHNTVDITSHDTYVDGVPHETFAKMRAESPVAWTEESNGARGFWSLTKYDDVLFGEAPKSPSAIGLFGPRDG